MQSRPFHIFVVDEDRDLREMVAGYLERQSFVVTTMVSTQEVLRRIQGVRPDLIVLDVNRPGAPALQVCRELRVAADRVPIILLTARGQETARRVAHEKVADACLSKPFFARELLARIHDVLRHSNQPSGMPIPEERDVEIGRFTFRLATRSLHDRIDGSVRVLSTVEYAILTELVSNPRMPVSRDRLLVVSHVRPASRLPRTIDTSIMRLRRLVEPDPAVSVHIQTVRGHGYMFVPKKRAVGDS